MISCCMFVGDVSGQVHGIVVVTEDVDLDIDCLRIVVCKLK